MKPTVLAACLAMVAGQANALSCLRPDPIATYQQLAAAEESYFVIYGTLRFDADLLPPSLQETPMGTPAPIPAQFTGKGLTRDGFTADYASPVTLQVTCAGPWCGTAQSGGEAVYFAPFGQTPVTLTADPCGGMIFPDPSPAVLAMLESCMRGDTCVSVDAALK